MQRLSPEQFERAKTSFSRDWGAPKSTRAVLGTYDNPETFWKNFAKYYSEDEVVDLSGVPGFAPGDLGIPIKDRQKDSDPLWTVFNPSGLDFGDVAEHADIVANILGYAGVKVASGVAGTPGGPVGQLGAIVASEAKANAAAQGAEALWDTTVRGLADPYHGELEGDGILDYAGDRAKAYALETGVGTAAEVGMNMTGSGLKKLVTAPFRKLFGSPDHPTATKEVENTGLFGRKKDGTKTVPMSYAENIAQTARDLQWPTTKGLTTKQLDEAYEANSKYVMDTWNNTSPAGAEDREALIRMVQNLNRSDRDSAEKWLARFADPKVPREDKYMMNAVLAAAQDGIYPIKIGLPSLGTVSHNRLIQLGEGFSNLFPMGHEIFERSYSDMIQDIHKGMERTALSWLRGKQYWPRTEDEIDEVISNSMLNLQGSNVHLWGDELDDLATEFKSMPIDEKLKMLEGVEAANARGFFEPAEGNIKAFPQHAPGTPAYLEDIANQHGADRFIHGGEILPRLRDSISQDPITMTGRNAEQVRPIDEFPADITKIGDDISNMTGEQINRELNRLIENSAIASKDAIGGFARQGLEAGHKQTMRNLDEGFDLIYKHTAQRAAADDRMMMPSMRNIGLVRNELLAELNRISPTGGDIIGTAYKRADNIFKGLQPNYAIAQDILNKIVTPPSNLQGESLRDFNDGIAHLMPLVDELKVLRDPDAGGALVDPEKFYHGLSDAVAATGDIDLADLMVKFDESVPTIKDAAREYDRLGEVIGYNKNDPELPIAELQKVRDALKLDIEDSFLQAGKGADDSLLGGGGIVNPGLRWSQFDEVKQDYLNDTYYPMIRSILESGSDKHAYDLLFDATREGPNKLKTLFDNMPHDAQNAIKAGVFLRLGKENPQNYDYSDFDLHKFVRDWKKIPESNKEIMWGTEGGLRDSMERFADQIANLEHIQDRAGQGAVGQIVASTVIVGGMLGGVTGLAFTNDVAAAAGGAITGSVLLPASILGASWGLGKLFTNKRFIDSYVGLIDDATAAGRKGMLKQFFDAGKGGFRIGVNRMLAISAEEGLLSEAQAAVDNMNKALEATVAELGTLGWDKDRSDLSDPENMQWLLEGMDESQALELRTGMTPGRIKTMEDIYSEAMGAP